MTCIKDFAPVTQLAASYGLALITNLPVKSVAELVALAKKKPGQLTFATNGVGNVTHVAGLLFDARTGMKMIAVPYNTPNLITDVMTGQVDMAFYSVAAAAPLVKAGKIKALALTGSRRAPALPDTPTLQELGYKDFDVTGYFGLLFPAGTPHERIDAIYRGLQGRAVVAAAQARARRVRYVPGRLKPRGIRGIPEAGLRLSGQADERARAEGEVSCRELRNSEWRIGCPAIRHSPFARYFQ